MGMFFMATYFTETNTNLSVHTPHHQRLLQNCHVFLPQFLTRFPVSNTKKNINTLKFWYKIKLVLVEILFIQYVRY